MPERSWREDAPSAAGSVARKCTVLVVGTDDWAIEQAASELEAAGDPVLRCHEPGEPAFPCNAMLAGRVCPIDAGFEVVADVRSRATSGLAQAELGVVCAARLGRPIVAAGVAGELPSHRWFGRSVPDHGNLVTVCEETAAGQGGGMIPAPAFERSQSL